MTLDDLRAARPSLGFALYAYTPGGDVTLEIHDGGEVFTFAAPTEGEAIASAFPPCSCVPPVIAPEASGGTHEPSVFD